MNYSEFIAIFNSEDEILDIIIKLRYGDDMKCGHCSSPKIHRRNNNPKVFMCKTCNNHFSALKGTIFGYTSTDLKKWFYAIYVHQHSKRLNALKLMDEINVTYKTSWRIANILKNIKNRTEIRLLIKLRSYINTRIQNSSIKVN
jgi:transposase-like protein